MANIDLTRFGHHIDKYDLLTPLDILIVGPTGVGKSTTINSLMGKEVAKVGTGTDPETQEVSEYALSEFLRIHDTAGLGDGDFADKKHKAAIQRELNRTCGDRGEYLFFDLVLLLLDASSKDLGTAYKIVVDVLRENIDDDRIIVATNHADLAMKGRNWSVADASPEKELRLYLKEQSDSFCKRITETTGLKLKEPIAFSAKEEYNLERLIQHIEMHLPKARRRAA